MDEMFSKIVIILPYKKGTSEYDNAMDHLGEWSAINNNEIKIIECRQCEICGVTDDTVQRSYIPEEGDKYLCDYCYKDLEA